MSIPKRSLCHGALKTSVSLEDEFWIELQRMAKAKGMPVGEFALWLRARIGADGNLASGLRVMILADLQEQVSNKSRIIAGLRQQAAE